MLEIELDVYSGMPNPTWMLSRREEATLYGLLKDDPKQIAPSITANARLGLGYRGLIVRRIKTGDGPWEIGAGILGIAALLTTHSGPHFAGDGAVQLRHIKLFSGHAGRALQARALAHP